ncbi:MAG: flagellar filament capping protein FliD [Firmicutes bacterium]|nr:flagellar filament capping protein FliD [Bacillota bacterium]MCL5040448.1 flagellar filament capping protein FliD [Bacillota bacterium]
MSGVYSVSGLASGLDWRKMVDDLMKIEHRPVDLMQAQQDKLTAAKGVWSDIKTQLAALDLSLSNLSLDTAYNGRIASSANETVVTATASSGAAVGTYALTVGGLAQAHSVASDTKASTYAVSAGAAGTFQIKVIDSTGATVSTSVTAAAGDSLTNVAQNINTAKAGVTASVITTSTGFQRLVITRNVTGANSTISFVDTNTTAGALAEMGVVVDSAGNAVKNQLVGAQDASFTVNNVAVTRSTNTVSDAVTGVTFNLKALSATAVNVTVSQDVDGTYNKIKDFVDKYNAALDLMTAKMAKGEVLQGDATLSRIQSTLRQMVSDRVSGATGSFTSLFDIGISTSDNAGHLAIDDTKLRAAIADKPQDVKTLLFDASTSVNGVGEKLRSELALAITGTGLNPGIIPARLTGLDRSITDLGNQMKSMEDRLALRRDTLVKQFVAMEQTVGLLQGQSSWLSGQLSGLLR